jgi:hypothetical protein
MGPLEPVTEIRGHELCLLFEMIGATQKITNTLGSIVRH